MIARCCCVTVAGFRVSTARQRAKTRQISFCSSGDGSLHTSSAPTQGHPSPGRSAPPRSAAESVRADTLRALPEGVASPSRKVADKQNAQRPNRDSSPPPHTQNTQPTRNTLNRDSPPRPSSLGTGRTRNPAYLPQPRRDRSVPQIPIRAEVHISPAAAPGNQARKDGIACSDIRVSEAKRGRVPCRNEGEYRLPSAHIRSKEDICTSHHKSALFGERKNPADSEESAGSFFEVRPLGLEPRTH